MRSTCVILAGCLILCSLDASWARGDARSPKRLSAIAAEYFGFLLNCLIQTSEADSQLPQWGKAEDPAGDCKFASTGDTLSISVPGTYHGLSPASRNFLAPRVLRNVSGDFSIEVQLRCFRPLASGASITATAANDKVAGLGLLIWQDEKNFIRFTQEADSDRQRQVVQLSVGETLNIEYAYEFEIEYLHLKVSRIGKVFSVAISEDGKRWQVPAISLQSSFYRATAGFGDSLRAGVMVVNGIGQEIHGEFQQLKVSTEPAYVVHDVFPASPEFRKTPMLELLDPRVQQELKLESEFLSRLKELDARVRLLPAAERQHENAKPAREAWALLRPMLTAQQLKRLAGLELQRFGPRCLLIDIVHEQLGLDEQQLKNIERARELLDVSWAARDTFPRTPESDAKTKQLRLQAYELLCEAARSASQSRLEELKGDLFAYNLTGMVSLEEFPVGHALGPLADILSQPQVQQDLRLSRSATEAIEEFIEAKSPDVPKVIASLELDRSETPSSRVLGAWREAYAKVKAVRRELELECAKQLTAAQNTRLQQILFQAVGSPALLVSDSACDALELTDEQRDKLRQVEVRLAESQNFSNLICKPLCTVKDISDFLTEKQREQIEQQKGPAIRFVPVTR